MPDPAEKSAMVQLPRKMYEDLERAKSELHMMQEQLYSAGQVLDGVRITAVMAENPDPGTSASRLNAVLALQAMAVRVRRGA